MRRCSNAFERFLLIARPTGPAGALLALVLALGAAGVTTASAQTPAANNGYDVSTGGADAGCVEADVLQQWHRQGMFGAKIAGYAPVEVHDTKGFRQAVAFYGAAYLGVALPASAQEQFANGDAWTPEPGSPIVGGHCIVAVGYNPHAVYCVTWGQVIEVAWTWLADYCTEVWAILPNQFAEHGGDAAGLDLKSLQADLARL